MSLGKIIGRVAIKVLPDTTEFREKTANDLRRVEKQLGHVEVDVIPDLDDAAKRRVQAQLEAWAKSVSPIKIDVDLDVDRAALAKANKDINDAIDKDKKFTFSVDEGSLDSVRSAMKGLQNKIKDLAKVKVDVDLDEDALRAELDRLTRIERTLPLKIDVDKTSAASVRNALREIERELSDRSKVTMDIDLDTTSLRAARNELSRLSADLDVAAGAGNRLRSTVRGAAEAVGALGGVRYTLGLFRNLRNELMNLDLAVPKIGLVSHAVAVLGAWLLGVSGNLFSLSSSMAKMGQAALALPGILAGVAIGIGAIVAALMDFNVHVPQAEGYLKSLQQTISTNFWKPAAEPMREMVDTLFPVLNKHLAQTGTALGGFFAALTTSATDLLIPKLPGMFEGLNESIQVATQYTDAFVGIIEKLGTLGAEYLPRLAAWVGDIATQFDGWLDDVGLDGLKSMMETGITAMQQFGSATASFFSIWASLGRAAAAAGGSTLYTLSEGLRQTAEAAKDPAFQTGLTNTLRTVYDMLDEIGRIAGPAIKDLVVAMSENFQVLGPIIGETVGIALEAIASAFANPKVAEGSRAMFEGFNDMVKTLAPQMDLVAGKFAIVGEVVGVLASTIGTVLGAAIEALAPVLESLLTALKPIIQALGPMFAGVISALSPVFATLSTVFEKAGKALKPMFDALQRLVDLLLPILVPILDIVVTIIGDALVSAIDGVTWVIEGLIKIVEGVIAVFTGLWDIIAGAFMGDWGRVLDGIKGVFSGLGDIIMGALQGALGAVWAYLNGTLLGFLRGFGAKLIAPIAGPLGKIFTPLLNGAKKAFEGLKKAWSTITGLFNGGGGGITAAITAPFKAVGGIIKTYITIWKTIFTTAWNVIKTIFTAAWNVIKAIFTGAFNVIKTIIQTYITVWKTIFTAAWNVIKTIFTGAINGIKTVFTTGWTGIKVFIDETLTGIYNTFTGIWNMISSITLNFIVGVKMIWTTIKTFFDELLTGLIIRFQLAWESISTATTTVFNAISGFLLGIWNGIRGFIDEAVTLVRTVVVNVWNTIGTRTTNVWNGIKTLVMNAWNAIKTAVQNAINFVRDLIIRTWDRIKTVTTNAWNAVKNSVSNTWDSVKTTVSNAIATVRDRMSSGWSTIKSTVSNTWNTIKSTVSTAWNNIKTSVINGVNNARDEVKKLPDKAKDALKNIGTVLINAGKDLIKGFIDGIGQMFGAVKDKLGDLTGKLTDWKGPPKKDKVLLTAAGQQVIDGFIRGLENRFGDVRKALQGLTKGIGKTQVQGLTGHAIGDAIGSAIITGLNGSRQQILTHVTSLAVEIANALNRALSQSISVSLSASEPNVQAVDLDRRLGGLERHISVAARDQRQDTSSTNKGDTVQIDNISIPLEDLKQLKDLEEFLDMLRVYIRQG